MTPIFKSSMLGWGGALLVLGGLTLAPTAARAGSDGKKNTAIAVGAAALYELLNHKTTEGLVLGAGAAYAAKQYEDARHAESQKKNRSRYYERGYGYGNNNGYDNGDYETYGNPNDPGYSNDQGYGNTNGYSSTPDFRHMNRRNSDPTYGDQNYNGDQNYGNQPYNGDQTYNGSDQDYDSSALSLQHGRRKAFSRSH